jgi:hypothetical protein
MKKYQIMKDNKLLSSFETIELANSEIKKLLEEQPNQNITLGVVPEYKILPDVSGNQSN